MNLADYTGDYVYIQLKKIINSNSENEIKDIARLLLLLKPQKPDSVYFERFRDGFYFREFLDPQVYLNLTDTLKKFAATYPNSEFTPWVLKKAEKIEKFRSDYIEFLDYQKRKIHDGYIVAFPIQYQRFFFTPLFGSEDTPKRVWDGFLFTFGYDLFDSKYFKIQPFVGAWNPYVAGAQADFRFLQEKAVDSKLGVAVPFTKNQIRLYMGRFK